MNELSQLNLFEEKKLESNEEMKLTLLPKVKILEKASFTKRLVAFLIDLGIVNIITKIIYSTVFPLLSLITFKPYLQHESTLNLIFSGTFAWYFITFTFLTEATLGKMALRLRVKNIDGSKLSFKETVLRFSSYFFSMAPFGMGFLFPAMRKDKKALHDLIMDTEVIDISGIK